MSDVIAHPHLRLRSSIPGRQRWDVDGLFRNAALSEALHHRLTRTPCIHEVHANVRTGRLLLLFDATHVPREIVALLTAALNEVLASPALVPGLEPSPPLVESARRPSPPGSLRRMIPLRWQGGVVAFARRIDPTLPSPWVASSLTVAQTISQIMAPLSFGLAISIAIAGGMPLLAALGWRTALSQMVMLSVAAIVFKTAAVITEHRAAKAWTAYASAVVQAARVKTFRHLQHLDMAHVEDKNRSELLNLVTADMAKIQNCLASVPHTVIDKSLTFTIATASVLLLSPTSFVLAAIPVGTVYYLNRNRYADINRAYEEAARVSDELTQAVANNLNGMATVRSLNAESHEIVSLAEIGDRLIEKNRLAGEKNSAVASLTEYGVATGFILPILRGAFQVYEGVLDFNLFNVQVSMLPFVILTTRGLRDHYELYQSAKSASVRINHILATPIRIIEGPEPLEVEAVAGEIHFKALSFAYHQEKPIFDALDLRIPARQSVAIVGKSGSGKSTLVKLLLRFYDKQAGELRLDGKKIDDFRIHDLRQAIGLVSQEVFLFNGTIEENIRYGRPEATWEQVIEAAKTASALDFIHALPEGFATKVGESGAKLSGGQRQRLALARTILNEPPILILDEATSALDNETETQILRALRRFARGRTTVMVTHRLSAIRSADCIFLIDEGRLVEQGTHEELLALGGLYAAQWELQTGERALKVAEPLDYEFAG